MRRLIIIYDDNLYAKHSTELLQYIDGLGKSPYSVY